MRLTFVGTRANISRRTRQRQRHAALLVAEGGSRVLVDCGADWLGGFEALRPEAIVLTHAHSDHACGLAAGASCPVYATAETWARLRALPIAHREVMPLREPTVLGGVVFEAFPLEHSVLAPAVGYRITAGKRSVFYAPDVAAILDEAAALRGVSLYIGDGATVTRPMLRRRDAAMRRRAQAKLQILDCAGSMRSCRIVRFSSAPLPRTGE